MQLIPVEFVPAAPIAWAVLEAIGTITLWAVSLGLIGAGVYFLRSIHWILSKTVGHVPIIGGSIVATVDGWLQPFSNYMAEAFNTVDARLGMHWHRFARLVDHIGRELTGLALLTLTLAKVLTGQVTPQDLARLWHDLRAAGASAEHAAEHALGRVGGLEHTVAKEVEGLVIPWERTIQHELDHVFTPELRALRERAKSLEDSALDTFRWIRAHPLSLATGAFVGAIAYAIGRLGMGWTRCAANRGLGRFICGLGPQLFESLLSDAFEALIVLDLCEMIALMSAAAREFEPVLVGFVDVEDALIGCHGATLPAALALPALQLPPSPGALALA